MGEDQWSRVSGSLQSEGTDKVIFVYHGVPHRI